MKKIIFVILFLLVFSTLSSYALDTGLFEMRNKIVVESKQLKSLLLESKDMVLMSSMWDSCVMTMTQLDAYFYMVGIFNSVKNPGDQTINFLVNWLKIIKSTSDLNIKSLDASTQIVEGRTKTYKEKLKKDFIELNKNIDAELGRVTLLKKVVKPVKKL